MGGRSNHNTSRIKPLLDGLQKANIAVQLKHDSKETTWESHGYVKVTSANGKVIAEHENVQHNRQWGQRIDILDKMTKEIVAYFDTLKEATARKVWRKAKETRVFTI